MGVTPPGREGLLLGHQTAQPPKDAFSLRHLPEPETANEKRAVLDDGRTQRVAVLGRPAQGQANSRKTLPSGLAGTALFIFIKRYVSTDQNHLRAN